jgi:hypothetical protein
VPALATLGTIIIVDSALTPMTDAINCLGVEYHELSSPLRLDLLASMNSFHLMKTS